jgi:signal peptidase
VIRIAVTFAAWVLIGATAAVLALVTVPRALGMTPLTILSGSMQPEYAVGDVVVDERISPLEARTGDVVTFHDPSRGGDLVTHRVVRRVVNGSFVSFVTQGDANTGSERWSVPVGGSIGRVSLHVPLVGRAMMAARSPEGRMALIVFPAVLLVVVELAGLGSLRRRPQGSPA